MIRKLTSLPLAVISSLEEFVPDRRRARSSIFGAKCGIPYGVLVHLRFPCFQELKVAYQQLEDQQDGLRLTCRVLRHVLKSPSAAETRAVKLFVSASSFSAVQMLRIRPTNAFGATGENRMRRASGLKGRSTGAYLKGFHELLISLFRGRHAQIIADADDGTQDGFRVFLLTGCDGECISVHQVPQFD